MPATRPTEHPRKRARIRAKLRHQTSESFFAQTSPEITYEPLSEGAIPVNLFLFIFIKAQPTGKGDRSRRKKSRGTRSLMTPWPASAGSRVAAHSPNFLCARRVRPALWGFRFVSTRTLMLIPAGANAGTGSRPIWRRPTPDTESRAPLRRRFPFQHRMREERRGQNGAFHRRKRRRGL